MKPVKRILLILMGRRWMRRMTLSLIKLMVQLMNIFLKMLRKFVNVYMCNMYTAQSLGGQIYILMLWKTVREPSKCLMKEPSTGFVLLKTLLLSKKQLLLPGQLFFRQKLQTGGMFAMILTIKCLHRRCESTFTGQRLLTWFLFTATGYDKICMKIFKRFNIL